MREMLRLSLTLAVVGIISASLLTGVNSLTEPVIHEREQREYREALEKYFPSIYNFETEQYGKDYYDIIYDRSGGILGVMAIVRQQGYDGYITYNLAVDSDAVIIGLRIIAHSETPGIGNVIDTDPFKDQFTGRGFHDPIEAGIDVDIVSGATISTSSMISSIRRTVTVAGEEFLGKEIEAFDISAVPDGVYQGSVEGTYGLLNVEVEVIAGKIVRIDVIEQNETDAYFIEAHPLIRDRIISEQRLEVDTQTGATLSSERIVSAVRSALLRALD